MTQENSKTWLGNVLDAAGKKVNDVLGEKAGERVKAALKIGAAATVITYAWPILSSAWIIAPAVAYVGWRGARKQPILDPIVNLTKDLFGAVRTLFTGVVAPLAQKIDNALDKKDGPESASDLGNKSAQGPFNNGKTPAANNNAAPSAAKKHTP